MTEGFRCELISWRQVVNLSQRLAYLVRQDGFRPDIIVAIGRGGYVPARLLSDLLGQDNLTGFKIEHYKAGAHMEPVARIRYPLAADLSGLKVLVVDDVSDTGDTFHIALEHIHAAGAIEVKTAVLHHKTVSRHTPDFFAHKVIKWRWIIYPWAVVEDLTGFIQRMTPAPATVEQAAQRLREEFLLRAPSDTLRFAWALAHAETLDSSRK